MRRDGIDAVTIESNGRSATLTAETGRSIDRQLREAGERAVRLARNGKEPKPSAEPTAFWPARDAEALAQQLIADHHGHLASEPILFLFTNKTATYRKASVYAKTSKLTPLQRYLQAGDATEGDHWIIVFSDELWQRLDGPARAALVDHELHHLELDAETGELYLRGHDIEEFAAVARRHGAWDAGRRIFAEALQARLPLGV